MDSAKQYVEYTRIKAPFDGVITLRNYYDGDFIRTATGGGNVPSTGGPLLRVARTDKMRVVVQLPDRYIPYANPGDDVTLTIDSLPNKTFSGSISRMVRAEVYDTRYMRVEIDEENSDGLLQDGMYGSATIVLEKERPGVQIPSSCLVGAESQGMRSVYVVRDGQAKRREVTIGDDNGLHAQILSGLTADDQVITGQLGSLKDGMPVKVVGTKITEQASPPRQRASTTQDTSATHTPEARTSPEDQGGPTK